MDQMTAALGEADRLLALRCQPAEVQGSAPIPPHLRFWGVDSGEEAGVVCWQQAGVCVQRTPSGVDVPGLRCTEGRSAVSAAACQVPDLQPPPLRPAGKAHCVGGSDYAHVRVGAFMGLRICSALAAQQAAQQAACNGGSSSGNGAAADGGSLVGSEAVQTIGAPPVCCVCDSQATVHAAALLTACALSRASALPRPAMSVDAYHPTVLFDSFDSPPYVPCAGNGYLCNVPPSQFTARFEQQLPEALSGAAFLEQYGPHLDSVTTVDPEQASVLQDVLVGLGELARYHWWFAFTGVAGWADHLWRWLALAGMTGAGATAPLPSLPCTPADICSADAHRPPCARELQGACLPTGQPRCLMPACSAICRAPCRHCCS